MLLQLHYQLQLQLEIRLIFTDYARNWGTNAVTLNPNSLNFQGNSSPNPVYDTNGQSVHIVYSGATKGWIPNSDDDVTLETPQTYSVDFLVVAGGGGGGTTILVVEVVEVCVLQHKA